MYVYCINYTQKVSLTQFTQVVLSFQNLIPKSKAVCSIPLQLGIFLKVLSDERKCSSNGFMQMRQIINETAWLEFGWMFIQTNIQDVVVLNISQNFEKLTADEMV